MVPKFTRNKVLQYTTLLNINDYLNFTLLENRSLSEQVHKILGTLAKCILVRKLNVVKNFDIFVLNFKAYECLKESILG